MFSTNITLEILAELAKVGSSTLTISKSLLKAPLPSEAISIQKKMKNMEVTYGSWLEWVFASKKLDYTLLIEKLENHREIFENQKESSKISKKDKS